MSNGLVIYRGPSELDGVPIIAVATGFDKASSNRKLGKSLVQTWILREDLNPYDAVLTGADASVCGDCMHRGATDGHKAINRTCYVLVLFAPLGIWRCYHSQPQVPLVELTRLFRGRGVRLGAYGDPAAVPPQVWHSVTAEAAFWTGYTHQWRTCDPIFAEWCMASCDSPTERIAAKTLGYRTFRVTVHDARHDHDRDEVVCPASAEMGHRTTCDRCRACGGTRGKMHHDVVITMHGPGAGRARRSAPAPVEPSKVSGDKGVLSCRRRTAAG
jgi:hypothetical protein